MTIRVKCYICKKPIEIDEFDFDSTMCKKKKKDDKLEFSHISCFVNKELKKKSNKKTSDYIIEKCKNDTLKVKKYIDNYILYQNFIRWLSSKYSYVSIPKWFLNRVDDVINGTYEGLTQPIVISELFDMWKLYSPKLDKIYVRNMNKSKDINRLAYDLAILISEYENYLKLKVQRESETKIQKTHLKKSQIDYSKIKSIKADASNEIDIYDIVDEI